jgi:hypothetical protein
VFRRGVNVTCTILMTGRVPHHAHTCAVQPAERLGGLFRGTLRWSSTHICIVYVYVYVCALDIHSSHSHTHIRPRVSCCGTAEDEESCTCFIGDVTYSNGVEHQPSTCMYKVVVV